MRHTSARFAALLIVAAMLLSLLPAGVFAASVDLTEIAQNEDEGLGQLFDVEDIISLSADEHHTYKIPIEGMTTAALNDELGNIVLSLDRDESRPYLDSTLYPNAKPGGTIMDDSVWKAQNNSAQFQNITMQVENQDGTTVLVVDFDSKCYFYSRNNVDYSAPHNNGGAYLFSADSGVGKSTHTKLWLRAFGDRVHIMNDDKPVVRLYDDRAVAFGTPFDGGSGIALNESYPLKAVVFVERAEENAVRVPQSKEIIQKLYFQTAHFVGAAAAEKMLDNFDRLLRLTRFYVLSCNMDVSAAYTAFEAIVGDN